jgi:hypothetical protein
MHTTQFEAPTIRRARAFLFGDPAVIINGVRYLPLEDAEAHYGACASAIELGFGRIAFEGREYIREGLLKFPLVVREIAPRHYPNFLATRFSPEARS